jgi:hypothetical protein
MRNNQSPMSALITMEKPWLGIALRCFLFLENDKIDSGNHHDYTDVDD